MDLSNEKGKNVSLKWFILLLVLVIILGTLIVLLLIDRNADSNKDNNKGNNSEEMYDFKVVNMYKNDGDEYIEISNIPDSNYLLNEDKSYCDVSGVKDSTLKISLKENKISVENATDKNANCYIYFDKIISAKDMILSNNSIKGEKTSFTGIATASDTGIYMAPDDYGISYYFRGLESSLNNWVKFAGNYWRIVRVNGNGTVRMIYAGVANGLPTDANRTGTTTQINGATYMYNHTYNDNAYVGYMMGIPLNGIEQTANETSNSSTSYEQAHTNTYDSDAKKTIDSWYKTNIEDKELNKYVDINTGFCNDRGLSKGTFGYHGDGYGTQNSAYAPAGRVYNGSSGWKTTQTPTLQCANKSRDLFTHVSANEGNKKLTYPVGMITSDEVLFAGGLGNAQNSTYYLNTNQNYWTMSPFLTPFSGMFVVYSEGLLTGSDVGVCNNLVGLRPVINLKADTKLKGKGSATLPFEIITS